MTNNEFMLHIKRQHIFSKPAGERPDRRYPQRRAAAKTSRSCENSAKTFATNNTKAERRMRPAFFLFPPERTKSAARLPRAAASASGAAAGHSPRTAAETAERTAARLAVILLRAGIRLTEKVRAENLPVQKAAGTLSETRRRQRAPCPRRTTGACARPLRQTAQSILGYAQYIRIGQNIEEIIPVLFQHLIKPRRIQRADILLKPSSSSSHRFPARSALARTPQKYCTASRRPRRQAPAV